MPTSSCMILCYNNTMKKLIRKIQRVFGKNHRDNRDRKNLQKSVEVGVDRAVKEYKATFEKLAEYDRS